MDQRVGIVPERYAGESIPARGPERDFCAAERREINRIGEKSTTLSAMPELLPSAGALDHEEPERSIVMFQSARIRPLNSLIFISDRGGGVAPEWERERLILSTASCISVGCYPEPDGPTELVQGAAGEVDPGRMPDFDGELETPEKNVEVSTVEREVVLSRGVPNRRTRVRV